MSIEQAKTFLNKIKASTVYAGIGKVGAWNVADKVDESLTNSPDSLTQDLNDAILLKKTFPNHYSMAALRYDWAPDTVYAECDPSDQELSSKKFYCVNDSGIVYKCISNAGGKPSTEMPNATTPERFTTSDGYTWKLVAVIPEPISILFNNSTYIPVTTLTESTPEYAIQYASQMAAVGGTIDRIDVVQPGKKYSNQTFVRIIGDGHGAKAEPVIHAITGEILSVNIVETGFGYSFVNVFIVDPANIHGEGAIVKAIVSPAGGHGADPETELFASWVIGSVLLQGDEEGFIEGTFDFRKVFLVSDMVQPTPAVIQTSPRAGYTTVNPSETFQVMIRATTGTRAKELKIKTTVTGLAFSVFDSESAPYGDQEQWFTDAGISVGFNPTNYTWTIDFGTAKTAEIKASEFSIYAQLNDENGNPIFGNIDAPLVGNTFTYTFDEDDTVSNIPQDIFYNNAAIDDPRYEYTIKLNLADISGTFEMGEEVSFLNGGTATVVFVGMDYIKVSSPITVMTGKINGKISGANANVTSYVGRPFGYSGVAMYQHYFDKRTKLSDQNLKLVPVFKF